MEAVALSNDLEILGEHFGIQRTLNIFHATGEVVEIRIPKAGANQTVSGYFDDFNIASQQLEIWNKRVAGIYFTLNPIRPELIGRAANRLVSHAKTTTADNDVIARKWLPIDVDPIRPSGISSSNSEHQAAILKAATIKIWLVRQGWPEPIVADSGNGAHLLFPIDLPNDQSAQLLCQQVLKAIAYEFDDDESIIDQSVYNASRIWKLYGTYSCKGDSLIQRPHRQSRILSIPKSLAPIQIELLKALQSPNDDLVSSNSPIKGASSFDVGAWLQRAGLTVVRTGNWNGGTRWVLDQCPFNSEHNDAAAAIVQFSSGAIAFRCHHNGCLGKKWQDLRRLKEPGYQQRESGFTLQSVATEWPPLSLPSNNLHPVAPFDAALMPEAFRAYVTDVAERLQCPPDFSAAAAMTFAGGVLGRRLGIRPKRQDDWLVVPNLWGAAIGRPGVMKTPAVAQVQVFVSRLEVESRNTYQAQKLEYDRRDEILAIESRAIRKAAEDLIKKGAREDAERKIGEMPVCVAPPTRTRYVVNDTTVEKLGELLSDNPRGLILVRDELVGFLKSLDKVGNETQRAFMLEAWNGDGRFTYDRIVRETVEIEAACVSIFGGIQPGPFAEYLRAAIDAGSGDDGLIQRFQLVVWPDVSSDWRNVDRWPNTQAKEQMWQAFRFLSSIDGAIGEQDRLNPTGIPFLRFADEAQERFDDWRNKLEHSVRTGSHHPAFESHLSKYRSLIPSIALICHLADAGSGPVGTTAIIRALAWAEYLESHARRIYSLGLSPARSAAHELVNHIRRGALTNPFKLRDVYRNNWRSLGTPELSEGAVGILEDHGCIRAVTEQETGGRPGTVYFIHPELIGGNV